MTLEDLRSHCLAMPGVTENIKWEDHLCFSLGGKMFLITAPDNHPVSASFKTSDELFEELPTREGIIPAPYLARYKWLFVDDFQRFTRAEWEAFLRISYNIVFAKLSGKAKKLIQ